MSLSLRNPAWAVHLNSEQPYLKRSAAAGSRGCPAGQRTSDQQRPYIQLGGAAGRSSPGGFTRRGRGRGQSRSPAPSSGQKPPVRPDSAPSLASTAAARPTHLATASTEPGIGAPPSSPPSYSTPDMSSSTPRTPASRLSHAAIALRCVPQTPRPNPRLGTAGGLAAQGAPGKCSPGLFSPAGWGGASRLGRVQTRNRGTQTPDPGCGLSIPGSHAPEMGASSPSGQKPGKAKNKPVGNSQPPLKPEQVKSRQGSTCKSSKR